MDVLVGAMLANDNAHFAFSDQMGIQIPSQKRFITLFVGANDFFIQACLDVVLNVESDTL